LRRLLATLLLVLFTLSLLSPAFGSDSDTGVPACCRRNGAHHCLMAGSMLGARGAQPGFRNNRKCPLYSGFSLMPGHASSIIHPPFAADSIPFRTASILVRQTDLARAVSASRAHSKRGPPSV
jgi:hypothetical protein